MTTVDRYCAEHEIARIDPLKLDVEGHELDVFDGAARMLSQRRIGLVAVEFGGTNIDSRVFFREIYNRLLEAAMTVGRITPIGLCLPLAELSGDLRTISGHKLSGSAVRARNGVRAPSAVHFTQAFSIFVHFDLDFEDLTTVAMKAMPITPSSIVGKS